MTRVAALLLVSAIVLTVPSAAEEPGELAVIVHPTRTVVLDLNDLRHIYLKQRRFWPDGSPMVPINHEEGPLRRIFDQIVGDGVPAGLAAYWNRRYFEGVLPPITLRSDEAVRRYVASKINAVGYVDSRAVDESVRVVLRFPAKPLASSRHRHQLSETSSSMKRSSLIGCGRRASPRWRAACR